MSSALKKMDGVKDVRINMEKATATIVYDDTKTAVEAMAQVLKDRGFPPKGNPTYLK
ncbi:MAG TPA: cation transporter [Syntrophales bacterium]|nr:cation transporter [Syntrophales bacterium]HOX94664.1 cation transporter [Syntrophales bacterium]HPI56831.1 cation transporter [Syntrophales bacterium]HPN25731.1 cation transporter [Syntrophales bacterium]HQM28696.1 cation transporter [Syntrophales bacterium]